MVTVAELLHGVYRADTAERRAARLACAESILRAIPILPYDEQVARVLAPLDAQLQANGNKIAIADLIIAAPAIAQGRTLLHRDGIGFPRIRP